MAMVTIKWGDEEYKVKVPDGENCKDVARLLHAAKTSGEPVLQGVSVGEETVSSGGVSKVVLEGGSRVDEAGIQPLVDRVYKLHARHGTEKGQASAKPSSADSVEHDGEERVTGEAGVLKADGNKDLQKAVKAFEDLQHRRVRKLENASELAKLLHEYEDKRREAGHGLRGYTVTKGSISSGSNTLRQYEAEAELMNLEKQMEKLMGDGDSFRGCNTQDIGIMVRKKMMEDYRAAVNDTSGIKGYLDQRSTLVREAEGASEKVELELRAGARRERNAEDKEATRRYKACLELGKQLNEVRTIWFDNRGRRSELGREVERKLIGHLGRIQGAEASIAKGPVADSGSVRRPSTGGGGSVASSSVEGAKDSELWWKEHLKEVFKGLKIQDQDRKGLVAKLGGANNWEDIEADCNKTEEVRKVMDGVTFTGNGVNFSSGCKVAVMAKHNAALVEKFDTLVVTAKGEPREFRFNCEMIRKQADPNEIIRQITEAQANGPLSRLNELERQYGTRDRQDQLTGSAGVMNAGKERTQAATIQPTRPAQLGVGAAAAAQAPRVGAGAANKTGVDKDRAGAGPKQRGGLMERAGEAVSAGTEAASMAATAVCNTALGDILGSVF